MKGIRKVKRKFRNDGDIREIGMSNMPYMPKVPNMPLFVQRTGGQVGKGQEAG